MKTQEQRARDLRAMKAAAEDPHCGMRLALVPRIAAVEAFATFLAAQQQLRSAPCPRS